MGQNYQSTNQCTRPFISKYWHPNAPLVFSWQYYSRLPPFLLNSKHKVPCVKAVPETSSPLSLCFLTNLISVHLDGPLMISRRIWSQECLFSTQAALTGLVCALSSPCKHNFIQQQSASVTIQTNNIISDS